MAEPAGSRWIWIGVVLVALLGWLLRALAFGLPPELNIDETRYLVVAHHVRTGFGYSDWQGPEVDIQPLHPLLTALAGADPATLELRGRLVAWLAACASLLVLGGLAWRFVGPRPALLYVLMLALHPWLVEQAVRPQPESLYLALVGSALLLLARAKDGGRAVWPWMGGGFLFGLAYLARPEGVIVALVAFGVAAGHRPRGLAPGLGSLLLFALGLVLAAAPQWCYLREATGGWTITGKSAEAFFIGQAMHEAGGRPPTAEAYLALMNRYGGILPFVLEHPADVLLRAARFTARVWLHFVPRGLGLLGVAGWAAFLLTPGGWTWLRERALLLTPAVALLLIVLAVPEERVVATSLPFLLLPPAWWFGTQLERRVRTFRGAMIALVLLVLLSLAIWAPVAGRVRSRGALERDSATKTSIHAALQLAGGPQLVSSDNPAISFRAGDPAILGPAGRYRPLSPETSCTALDEELRRRGARVAILDGGVSPLARDLIVTSDCSMQEVLRLNGPDDGRVLRVLARR